MSARREAEGLKYGLAETAKAPETLEFSVSDLGQRNPQHCPPPAEVIQAANSPGSARRSDGHRPGGSASRLLRLDGPPAISAPGPTPSSGLRFGEARLLSGAGRRLDSQKTKTERRTTAVTLYRRGRKYSISVWVDGVRHLKSTGTTNRREAEGIEREFREETEPAAAPDSRGLA